MNILKNGTVQIALVSLIAAILLVFGIEIPQEQITEALNSGDVAALISLVVGAAVGVLGGYGAGKTRKD